MQAVDETLSIKMANMSFLCACLVVSIHIGISGPIGSPCWMLKEFISEGIARIAVPYFFCASAYFIAQKSSAESWRYIDQVKKRVRTLLLPYWAWNLLFAICLFGMASFSDYVAQRGIRPLEIGRIVSQILGVDVVNGPILYPLWYVRTLFVYVILFPVFAYPVRLFSHVWMMILYIGYALLIGVVPDNTINIVSVEGIFYFSLGIYLGLQNRRSRNLYGKYYGIMVFVAGILLLVFAKVVKSNFNFMPLIIPFLLDGVWLLLPIVYKTRHQLARFSFGVYIIHPFVLLLLQYLWHLTSWMPNWVEFVFRWMVAVGGSIGIVRLFDKQFPRANSFLLGGRN